MPCLKDAAILLPALKIFISHFKNWAKNENFLNEPINKKPIVATTTEKRRKKRKWGKRSLPPLQNLSYYRTDVRLRARPLSAAGAANKSGVWWGGSDRRLRSRRRK